MSRRRIYKRNEVLQRKGGGEFLERESKKQKSEQCIA